MDNANELIKTVNIPKNMRKRTMLASNIYYDVLEVYSNKVVGYLNGAKNMTWFFKDYTGIDFVKANINSQFAQIVFLTGINSNNRAVGIDLNCRQNEIAVQDTNRILFCSGMFSFSKTNEFTSPIVSEIRNIFEIQHAEKEINKASPQISIADEISKFKKLFDNGILTEQEFIEKKKQLLNL